MEVLDIYDRNKVFTGRTIERDPKNVRLMDDDDYILYVMAILINSDDKILVTRRGFHKSLYPGKWETSGGCALTGEDSLSAIKRELFEEIGYESNEEIKLIETIIESKADGYSHGTIRDVYLIKTEWKIDDFKFNDGEVIDKKYVSIKEFDEMLESGDIAGKDYVADAIYASKKYWN